MTLWAKISYLKKGEMLFVILSTVVVNFFLYACVKRQFLEFSILFDYFTIPDLVGFFF